MMPLHTTTISASSIQIRRRTFLLRIGEPLRRKERRNKSGVKKEPHCQFQHCRQHPHPAWLAGENKRPQFLIPLRGKIGVMRLMRRPIEAEAHEAEDAQQHTIELIEAPVLSQQPMRRLMQSHSGPMHEMTRQQHQRHHHPE